MSKSVKLTAPKRAAKDGAAYKRAANRKAEASPETLIWRDVSARVRLTPDYLIKGWTHIELIVVKPKGAPLPVTSTGYLSRFIEADELERAGGSVAFFLAWIEREAKTKAWAKRDFEWRQMTLPFRGTKKPRYFWV